MLSVILASLLSVTVQDAALPTVAELGYSEAFLCSALAEKGRETYFGPTTPQTPGEHRIFDALMQVETAAKAQMAVAYTASAYNEITASGAQTAALAGIAQAEPDVTANALVSCATIFGVDMR